MTHQKRIAATKRMPLGRKSNKYIVCQSPGSHKKQESLALVVVLRDILKLLKTTREVKRILNQGKVKVNGKVIKNHKTAIGFLDEISFVDQKEYYLTIYNLLGKLQFKETSSPTPIPLMVRGKKILNKGIIQVNLSTGKNILLDKANYKVGDSVIIEKNKVKKHLKFEKGAKVFLTAGKHIGYSGTIENIKETTWPQTKMIIVKTKKGVFETPRKYAHIIEKEF
jgi:small subunit ribosomal protein S4e